MVLAVIRQRMKGIAVPGCYTVPGGLLIPVAAVLAIAWFLSKLSANEIWGMLIFLGVLTLSYLLLNRFNARTSKKG